MPRTNVYYSEADADLYAGEGVSRRVTSALRLVRDVSDVVDPDDLSRMTRSIGGLRRFSDNPAASAVALAERVFLDAAGAADYLRGIGMTGAEILALARGLVNEPTMWGAPLHRAVFRAAWPTPATCVSSRDAWLRELVAERDDVSRALFDIGRALSVAPDSRFARALDMDRPPAPPAPA